MNKYLLISLMLFSTNAFPELIKWVDERGQVHYSDVPPADSNTKVLRSTSKNTGSNSTENPSASIAPAEPKTIAEQEVELKKAQQAKKEAADKAAKKQASADNDKAYCASLQKKLRALQDGMRMADIDANGNRFILDDEQRQQHIAKTQQDISANCK